MSTSPSLGPMLNSWILLTSGNSPVLFPTEAGLPSCPEAWGVYSDSGCSQTLLAPHCHSILASPREGFGCWLETPSFHVVFCLSWATPSGTRGSLWQDSRDHRWCPGWMGQGRCPACCAISLAWLSFQHWLPILSPFWGFLGTAHDPLPGGTHSPPASQLLMPPMCGQGPHALQTGVCHAQCYMFSLTARTVTSLDPWTSPHAWPSTCPIHPAGHTDSAPDCRITLAPCLL